MKFLTIRSTIKAFCMDCANYGDIVFFSEQAEVNSPYFKVTRNRTNNSYHAGLLLSNVVKLDLTKQVPRFNEAPIGNLVEVANSGQFIIKIPSRIGKLPVGQPLYASKRGKWTLKAYGPVVGRTITPVDKNGYVTIRLEI